MQQFQTQTSSPPSPLKSLLASITDLAKSNNIPSKKPEITTEIKLCRIFHEDHGVVEIFIPSGCSQTHKWEECRFYFRANGNRLPLDTKAMFRLNARSNNNQKFSSVVALCNNCPVAETVVTSRHLYFNSTQDACECKLDMFFYARTLFEEKFVDELAAATLTRQFFGPSFDAAFPSYKAFIDALRETHFESKFFKDPSLTTNIGIIHECGERMIHQNNWESDRTYIHVTIFNLANKTAEEVGQSRTECQNIAKEADGTLDDLIQFTQQSRRYFVLATFSFDSDSIFLFYGGGFWRIQSQQFSTFPSGFREYRVGTVLNEMEIVCVKRYWDGRREYGVRLADSDGNDSEDYDVVSTEELVM